MRQTLAGFGLLIFAASAAPAASAQTVSLAGTWKLNRDASDDPMTKIKQATEKGPTVVAGMREGRGRIQTGAGGLDRPTDRSASGADAGAAGGGGGAAMAGMQSGEFGRVVRPAIQITVEQNDSVLIVRDDRMAPQILYLDGRKIEEPMPGAEPMVVTAKWKDGKLTVEKKLGGSGSLREVYTLDPAKHRMVVDCKLTSTQMGGTVDIRRVYDAGN